MNNNKNAMANLPGEIIHEILKRAEAHSSDTVAGWSCDVLAASMACKAWYRAGLSFYRLSRDQEQSLGYACTSDHRSSRQDSASLGVLYLQELKQSDAHLARMVALLSESKKCGLDFHRLIYKFTVNLHMFKKDLEPKKNNSHTPSIQPSAVLLQQLVACCPSLRELEIIYDAGALPRLARVKDSAECSIRAELQSLADALVPVCASQTCRLFQCLRLTAAQQGQKRCPCCAGRMWDQLLAPLLELSPARTLVLDEVLPSKDILAVLDHNDDLSHLVLQRVTLVLPRKRALSDRLLGISDKAWSRIKMLEIVEDLDDDDDTNTYFTEMGLRIQSLCDLNIRFCPSRPLWPDTDPRRSDSDDGCINDLLGLVRQHAATLTSLVLCNVPRSDPRVVRTFVEELPHLRVQSASPQRIVLCSSAV